MRFSLVLQLALLALLLVSATTNAFDSRLSIGTALDTSELTMRTEFPASVGEQLHIFQFPLQIHGRRIEQMKVYSNGFIGIGNHSIELPPNYPSQTAYSQHRLGTLDGDFIGVFTTVNQCSPNGKIIIRDLDLNEVESSTCAWNHVSRIGTVIETSTASALKPFVADYIISITWEGMGCVPSSNPLKNTFTMALLRMEERTYVVFQYEDIQWTADHSTSSLPPEAGIFIHGVDTPQLPRSNMYIEPHVWNEESNIAVPGEWIFPLQEGPLDVDVAAQSKIRMATEDFLQMSSRFCENAESTEGSLSSVTEPSPIYVPSPSVETDVEAQVATDTTINQTGSYGDKTSENRRPIVSPERQFERCDNRACKTTMADCFKFDGQNCCVCPPAYYGGGAEGCWSIVPERPRRIYLDGQMQLNLEGPGRDPIVLFTFLDTEVKKDESILLQSGVHDVPQNFQSIHIMSPIFQFLNSFLAFPSQQCMNTDLMASRIFNVFSLASGFSTPFNFTFRLQVTDHGNLVVRGALLRQSSTEDTYRGSITIEVFPEGDFTPLTSTLVGTDGIFQSDEKHSRLIIYEKRCAGRLDFEPQVYTFKTGENKTVTVQVYGSGNALVEDGACILAENSLMAKGKKFFVKMDTQGYCREDCRSGSGCSFYCVDMPALYANTPGSCDCVICEQENEVCVPEGSSHSCKCKEGFKRNENGVCQEDRIQLRIDSVCQLHLDAGPCRGRMIRYGFDSQIGRCREFTYGGCLGNANNFETLAECEARCGTASSGAKSEDENDDVCQQPIIRGPCRASLSRFAYNPSTGNCEAFSYGGCRGNRNNFETKEECERRCLVAFANPCTTVRCGYNAHCVNGTCHCNEGYEGDARYECRPVYADRCADVRCGYNARCSDGVCVCEAGFEGDPYSHCRQIPDRCANVRCGYNARCSDGVCVCEDGFEGDPNIQCNRVADRCYNVRCGRYARCFDGVCYCESGYEGDPNYGCFPPNTDPCVNVRCGYNARCQNGTCYCEPGYDGDPNYECRLVGSDPCVNVRCGYNARCQNGTCYCEPGYDGDPNYECRLVGSDTLCSGVLCGENARCVNGQCRCESGFYGDPNYSCQFIGGDRPSANPRCRAPLDPGQCFARLEKYGYDSRTGRCEKFTYTGCQGNSNRFETLEECERECLSRQIGDKCATVQCGYNARCQDGYCVCEDGYEGDPNRECRLTDRCQGVQCGHNAQCIDGHCECLPGYEGDPRRECRTSENCRGQRCGPNAYCRDEVCQCETGYRDDPYSGCVRITDRCEGVQCAANAFCESGYCRCNPGYSGDGFIECIYQGSCANVHCGVNAQCVEGRCECWPGYEGDPDRMCEIASDQAFCGGRRCGQNAFCDRSRCVCERGFEGDPYDVCTPIPPKPELCGNNYCHEKARCHYGVCYCEYGYVGDGVTVCQKIEEDLCKRVQCAENAECEAGLCQCKTGYKGDGFSECTPVAVDPNSCNGRYCGANAECINNECTCISGYTGDPYDICTRERPLPDTCRGVECGSNAYCHDGRCVCYEGFVGNPNLACRPNHDASCIGIRCGVNAYCTNGQCVCRHGYTGDPAQICYPDWGSSGNDLCRGISCHPNATCSLGQCRCRDGFEGDGFLDCWPKDPANLCDCRGFPSTMAGCSNGKCRCMPGFWVGRDNYCDECRGHGECAANAQCSYDSQIQHYRCRCDYGFLGDGAIACIPGSVANKTQAAQCRIPCHKFGTCDEYDGRCKCRPGFVGNGYTYCDFDCSQCLAEARCVPESSQCICPPGYTGDGIRVCRPATSQGAFALQIVKDGDTIRVREGSGAFTLRCILSGDVHGVQARWLTPGDVGQTDEHQTHEGRELWLTLDEPNASNTGLYVCQASRMTDTVQVIIEPQKHSQSKQLFLTSDNGILTVETQKGPTTAAQIWHIAENNKHMRVALALDCKADHLVYTSDSGHALRFGNASAVRLSQPPEFIVHDAYSKFTWIAVDPTSGNVFAIDDKQKRIVVVNPGRPNQMYTFKKLYNRTSNDDFVVGGIAIHPGLSLVYWAQADSTDSAVKESVIMVASMADPNRVSEVVRVTGAPVSMSLAVSDGIVGTGNTAGRLCWLQRRQLLPYSRSEIHCAQLDVSGRNIHSKSVLRSFDTSEEPSCGLAQDDHAIFWTNLYRRTYQSHNPSSLVYVKGVCCSNGFQSMAIHNVCKRSMTNACSYENGRCRYFCLPGGRESSRTCRCPDDQPNCIAEHA